MTGSRRPRARPGTALLPAAAVASENALKRRPARNSA